MSDLTLTLAVGDYDHVRDLVSGAIRPAGIELRPLSLPIEQIFYRFARYREWEVSELSLAKHCALTDSPREHGDPGRGDPGRAGDSGLVGLPVFTSRAFRHGSVYVRAGGVTRAEDLAGARIGVPDWFQTTGVYVRGMLADDHGVATAGVTWTQAPLDGTGLQEVAPLATHGEVRVSAVQGRTLQDMLIEGDLDAIIAPREPRAFRAGGDAGPLVRLFADPRAAEQESFRRTGVFPILHLIAIRRDVYEASPWIGPSLMRAFTQARDSSLARLSDNGISRIPVPWSTRAVDDARQLLGPDLWPYGVNANQVTLSAFLRYARDQGITAGLRQPADLFDAALRD
jgi:4,5-dihydroxyphthalate decarboxylase